MEDRSAAPVRLDSEAHELAKTEGRDHVVNVMKALLNGIPVVGGAFASLVSDYIPTKKAERMRQFTEDVANELDRVAESLREDYVLTDEFAFLFERAYENVSRDYQAAKLEAYKNILVNALRYDVSAAIKESYLHRVENLTPMHLELLGVFLSDQRNAAKLGHAEGGTTGSLSNTIRRLVPNIPSNQIEALIHDLDVQGITDGVGSALRTTMTAHGAMQLEGRLTAFGHGFVRFIQI